MKKSFIYLAVAAIAILVASCVKPVPTPEPGPDGPEGPDGPGPGPDVPTLYDITVQLQSADGALAVEGIPVALADEDGLTSYEAATDASGKATFKVPAGTYTASATYKTAEDGQRVAFNGSNSAIVVKEGATSFAIELNKIVSQQVIIKEVYTTGCPNGESNTYSNDAYVILYNNSDLEADASDIVFAGMAPSMPSAAKNYYTDGENLLFEHEDWLPAYSALWFFDSEVKIPPYSQIVIALFGGVDHTQTVTASVNLSDPSYYWMNNKSIEAFTHNKYSISESIPTEHYLSGAQINMGTAWVVSNATPGFYIARMSKEDAIALAQNKDAYDTSLGTTAALANAKFPKSKVIDAVEIWGTASIAKSKNRYSADILTNYIVITNNKGYSVYRNVDKEATEALEENAGKLVYDYAGGTEDVEGSTDPSGIDAEASVAAGAHIIYSDTNDMAKDYHVRKVASIKK